MCELSKGFLAKKNGAMKLSLKNLSFEWRSHGVSTTMVSTLGTKARVERRLDHTGASSFHEASFALLSDQSAPIYVKPQNPHFLAPPMAALGIERPLPKTSEKDDRKKGKMGSNSALFPYTSICIKVSSILV